MQVSQYIVIKQRNRWSYGSRLTKDLPKLDSNEVAVKVSIELPDNIFTKPQFEAKIVIPKEAISRPVITSEVVDNVQEIIKQNTGFEVKLELIEKEGDD